MRSRLASVSGHPRSKPASRPPLQMIEHLPASRCPECRLVAAPPMRWCPRHPIEMTPTSVMGGGEVVSFTTRSEEHTSELQSLRHLVCRLLLEKKKREV